MIRFTNSAIIAAVSLFSIIAFGQAAEASATAATTSNTMTEPVTTEHGFSHSVYEPTLPVVVVVDQQTHRTHLLQQAEDGSVVEVLCVRNSTGKPSTPTPNGRTTVRCKEYDPTWVPPRSIDPRQRKVAPYSQTKKNPLGVANVRLNLDGGMIALHGTNEPNQIGKSVSHGCIRHNNADILKICKLIKKGTPVYITSSMSTLTLQPEDLQCSESSDASPKQAPTTDPGVQLNVSHASVVIPQS